jgi:hypothetical protein
MNGQRSAGQFGSNIMQDYVQPCSKLWFNILNAGKLLKCRNQIQEVYFPHE